MALDIQQSNLRALLIAMQPVAGSPVVLAPATDGMLVLEGDYAFSTDELERKLDKAGHGADPFVNIKRRSQFKGKIELRGAASVGTAAPISRILRACGFGETLTAPPSASAVYALVSSGYEMVTLGGYNSGSLITGQDGRGALTKIDLSIRQFATADFDVLALPGAVAVSDAALPEVVLTAFQPPVAIETETFAVTVGATSLDAISLSVDTGATAEIYEGSNSRFTRLKDLYKPSGTLKIFKEQRSAFNPEEIALANTLQDIFATITGGGETLRLDLKSVQLGMAKQVDQDGVVAWEIPFKTMGTTPTDCLSLSFLA